MTESSATAAEQSSPIAGISRNVFVLGIVSLLNDISSEMLYPLIPLFLTAALGFRGRGGSDRRRCGNDCQLAEGHFGWWSDRLGRRLPLVITGYSFSAVAKLLLALAQGWTLVLGARVLDRFGKGVRTTARDAILAAPTKSGQWPDHCLPCHY